MSLQPDSDPENRTLVEREGVNAGSDRSAAEGDDDLVSGPVASQRLMSGDDDTAARPASAQDRNGSDGHSAGAPATGARGGPPRELDGTDDLPAPDADAVESGQDNGSMG